MFRAAILASILLLSFYSYLHPIFESDSSKYEGRRVSLYFMEVLEERGSTYAVRSIYGGENMEVVPNAVLKKGSVVSFYGEIRNGKLTAEKLHIHSHPWMSYYLSALGAVALIFILHEEWKLEDFCFRRK